MKFLKTRNHKGLYRRQQPMGILSEAVVKEGWFFTLLSTRYLG